MVSETIGQEFDSLTAHHFEGEVVEMNEREQVLRRFGVAERDQPCFDPNAAENVVGWLWGHTVVCSRAVPPGEIRFSYQSN